MTKICVLVVFCCITTLALSASLSRILGGSDAPQEAYPYQVSLRSYGNHTCGGSILDKRHILTAAQCVFGASVESLTVVVGISRLSENGATYAVEAAIRHESYNPTIIINDIAILTLASDLEFNNLVQPIELQTEDVDEVPLILSGWGLTSFPSAVLSDPLQHINLTSISNKRCEKLLALANPVFESNICTLSSSGEGACQGDFGSPLVLEDRSKQVGIVSWGIPCARNNPDVFTRVSSFIEWIKDKVERY